MQVRKLRAEMSICPSAVKGVNIPGLLNEIIDKEVYKNAIEALGEIAGSGMFDE